MIAQLYLSALAGGLILAGAILIAGVIRDLISEED